jgi:crotonobetainyl-CoA:carnitine CoA-transferase CaiB-like acyl-CoA transferase
VGGPLEGIKVLDLAIAATGPYAAAMLADQGATVIKVERPGIGDLARWVGVAHNGMSALFLTCNRGKRSIAVDITTDDGRAIVLDLAKAADVVVQNFRPGVMDKHGLGYQHVAAVNPDVVYASLSGFGPVGPYKDRSAYDTVIQAYAGLATNQADPGDGKPTFLRQAAADKVTALTAAQAITAALLARERGAGGQHLTLSMADAVTSFLWIDAAGNEVLLETDNSLPSSFVQGFEPMPFADGWGIATPTSDADFIGICKAFDVQGWDHPAVATMADRAKRPPEMTDLMARLYEASGSTPTAEAVQRLEEQRVPFSVIVAPPDLPDDPHAREVGMFVDFDHPIAGRTRLPRHPAQFERTPAAYGLPSPGLGEHTDEILTELGLADRVAQLRAAGTVE